MKKGEPDGQSKGKLRRREQGKVRSEVFRLLNEGLGPEEICSRLGISQNTFYYHVKNLRAKGHVFAELAARRGRPAKTEEHIQLLAIKEQSRSQKMIKVLRILLEEAYQRGIIGFEVYREPLPHQSPLLERHPRLSGYDGVAALNAAELRLLRALVQELEMQEKNADSIREVLQDNFWEEESETLLKIVQALKTYDLTNLRENTRSVSERPPEVL